MARDMQTRLLPVIALCLLPARLFAGPDETTQYLMNDSASMLDLGMLTLNLRLSQNKLGYASYDWDANRIRIKYLLFQELNDEEAEEACAAWVQRVRVYAGINIKTGQPALETSSFAELFTHYGFQRKSEIDNLRHNIDKMVTLQYQHVRSGNPIMVNAPLLGTGYSLVK